MNIGIIGLGWLGLPLAKSLEKKGFTIFGTTTSLEKKLLLEKEGFQVFLLNLNEEQDENQLKDFFNTCTHCFLNIPPSKTNFQTYQNQLLKAVSFFNENAKFIFASSTSVYSEKVEIAFEDSLKITDYNFTSQLFLTEKALKLKLKENLTVIRFAGLFGENRNPARFLAGKSNLKNGNSAVNLVHQIDCIHFIKKILNENIWGECFNLCASEHPKRSEFYTSFCQKLNLEMPSFEQENLSNTSRIVSNEKSKKWNFIYQYDSPYDF
ncbi:MAG: NAD(P)-binding domain-containing protein [Bacteroidota bacterium]